MRSSSRPILLLLLAMVLPAPPARGTTLATNPDEFFEHRIRPLLAKNCYACHTNLKSGGLRMDSRESLLKGGQSGPAVIPGDPEASLLIQAVSYTHSRLKMPLGKPRLKDEEIADFKTWVKMGAPWPESVKVSPPPGKEFVITEEQRKHWAFQPCHKPDVPEVKDKTWPKSAADNFILAQLEGNGLKPVRLADKRILIRRAYFDLIGMPPKPEEIDAFLNDHSPEAFAKVVDRLLASPHYGERWGRHWLDVARYGEDDVRGLQQESYALAGVFSSSDYREYALVPESAVAEYQQHQKKMEDLKARIQEFTDAQSKQLGEILAWKTSQYLIAAWKVIKGLEPADKATREQQLDQETLERWVKYLTNPQKDHPYLKPWSDLLARNATPDEGKKVGMDFQATVLAMLAEKKEIDEENRIILALNKPAKDAGLVHLPNGFVPYEDFCPACNTAIRPMERNKFLLWRDLFTEENHNEDPTKRDGGVLVYKDEKLDRFLSGEWKGYLDSLRAELETLKKTSPPPYPFLHALADSPKPANLRIHLRGSPYSLGEEVPRRFIAALSEGEPPLFRSGSGRLELAEAIARHPLTARVMVNRLWQHHLGYRIVRTASNFGPLGQHPSHPELP